MKKVLGIISISLIIAFLALMSVLYNITSRDNPVVTNISYNVGYFIAIIIVPIGFLFLSKYLYKTGKSFLKQVP
jgi:hypothetical protein